MEEDDLRFPWQGNLPDAVRDSLEPFRQRLEAAYEPMTNPFELAQGRKRDRFSFSLE